MSRIAVTGVGMASPLGLGAEACFDALTSGRSALEAREGLGPEGPWRAAMMTEIPARDVLPATLTRRMDRVAKLCAVAGMEAVRHAALGDRSEDRDALGVVVGTALGNLSESVGFLDKVFARGASRASPNLFPNLVLNASASQLAIALGWRGPNLTVCDGEISGEVAIETAVGQLRRGRAKAILVAGADEICPEVVRLLRSYRLWSPGGGEREWASPFDCGANGPLPGEGGAAVLLEVEASARARGATILGYVESTLGFTLEAGAPWAWPSAAAVAAMGLRPLATAPDFVVCGADSSPARDVIEAGVAGALAPEAPLFSPKGAIGDFGSAGVTSVVLALQAMARGTLPPLAALETPIAVAAGRASRETRSGRFTRAAVLGLARGGGGVVVELGAAP